MIVLHAACIAFFTSGGTFAVWLVSLKRHIIQTLAASLPFLLASFRAVEEPRYLTEHRCGLFAQNQIGGVAAKRIVNHSLIAGDAFMKYAALWFVPFLCTSPNPRAINIQRTRAVRRCEFRMGHTIARRYKAEDWFPAGLQARCFVAVPPRWPGRNEIRFARCATFKNAVI